MSVEYKAMIVRGYELANDWELVVDADYVMAHEDNFIEVDAYEGEKVIFGSVLDSVEAGDWTEYSVYMTSAEEDAIFEFGTKYPSAVVNEYPTMYLACKVH